MFVLPRSFVPKNIKLILILNYDIHTDHTFYTFRFIMVHFQANPVTAADFPPDFPQEFHEYLENSPGQIWKVMVHHGDEVVLGFLYETFRTEQGFATHVDGETFRYDTLNELVGLHCEYPELMNEISTTWESLWSAMFDPEPEQEIPDEARMSPVIIKCCDGCNRRVDMTYGEALAFVFPPNEACLPNATRVIEFTEVIDLSS